MTTYRIAPYGYDLWKIQERVLWFWFDVTEMVGYDLIERVSFPSEQLAREWIDRQIAADAMRATKLAIAAERRRTTKPRAYP